MQLESDIDKYLHKIINIYGMKIGKQKIINLLEKNKPNELKKYSSKVISLMLEKKIVVAAEINLIKYNKSCWKIIKKDVSSFTKNKEIIRDFIDLFIFSINDKSNFENSNIKDIKKHYNKELKNAFDKAIALPNGMIIDFDDIIESSKKIFNNVDHKILSNFKIALLATASATAIISTSASLVEEKTSYTCEYQIDDHINDYGIEKANIDIIETKEELYYEKEFVGYENGLSYELQQYMYEISLKYDVPFPVLMTISHVESGGEFNTNGIVSNTNDYGLMQINECNINYIKDSLGFNKDDILNDPYKNIEASAFLIRDIYSIKENQELEEIFGIYNGWINWEKKNTSLDYVSKSLELYEQYNEQEIFEVNKKQIR